MYNELEQRVDSLENILAVFITETQKILAQTHRDIRSLNRAGLPS